MVNKTAVNQLLESLEKVLPFSQFTDEIKENIKESLASTLRDMDVVTRDEFEAQQQVLLKTRQKIDDLEKKLTQYNLDDKD